MSVSNRYHALMMFITFCLVFGFAAASSSADEMERHVNELEMTFVLIPAGTFLMGSPPDEPGHNPSEVQHTVTLSKSFYLQTTEVTLAQWRALMGKKLFGPRRGGEQEPVTRVSWQDCQKFIKVLNRRGQGTFRLPTESEWEYACRAGSLTAYFWGDTIDCTRAMYANNSMKARECIEYAEKRGFKTDGPAPVGSYAPNAWGLYDMHGNVWEWCQDDYSEHCFDHRSASGGNGAGSHSGICSNPVLVDPITRTGVLAKVRRGGSWYKYKESLRAANRAYSHPFSKLQTTGFRLVMEND